MPWRKLGLRGLARVFIRGARPAGPYNHTSAAEIRAAVPDEVWRDYYKFTIVRNPWDRMVSLYFYQTRREPQPGSFHDYLVGNPARVLDNWRQYTLDGRPVMDGVVRFEAFDETIAEISRAAGIPSTVLDVFRAQSAKTQFRDRSFRMSAADAALIGSLAEPEARAFGYEGPPPWLVAEDGS
ncbi:MAG: sulfotransferase family 2 domain-containing protein [Bauldia sp.]|nr:sulfotransferase family 2 domain-containing protein [Bauldia sp.]